MPKKPDRIESLGDSPIRLSVVIVSHNGGGTIEAAVTAVDRCASVPTELIVVDSGSSDGSTDTLSTERVVLRVISAGANVGFCAGNNIGARAARADILAFAQPDGVVQPGWDTAMLQAFSDESVVGAAGLSLDITGQRVDSAGIRIAPNLAAWSIDEYKPAALVMDRRGEDLIGGGPAFLGVRRTAHENIGGFWDEIFVYGDEPDYALRLRREGRIVFCPDATMHHHVGATCGPHQSPMRLHLSARNRLLNCARHLPTTRLAQGVALSLCFDLLALAQRRDLDSLRAITSGWREGLPKMRKARSLSTSTERRENLAALATIREALAQQRSLGRLRL